MTNYDMRYSARALPREEAYVILDRADCLVVSTVDDDGMPYGVPVSFVRSGDDLYLHCTNQGGHKADNFVRDERVCATAVCDVSPCYENNYFSTRYESVIARGRIRRIEDKEEMRRALTELCLKYVPSAEAEIAGAIDRGIAGTAIWAIHMDELSGKAGRTIG